MNCPKCKKKIAESNKYCPYCGALIQKAAEKEPKKKQNVVMKALDADGNGQIEITDIIILALKSPGVHVDRAAFLQKELFKNHSQEVIGDAIQRTPALAGISAEEIDKLADDVIVYERTFVSGISAALGVPGGWAMAATIPADIIQYYGYMLRAAQKLLYLYGFPDVKVDDQEGVLIDTETINEIILCLGAMNGIAGANNAIKGLAKAFAIGVEKKLMRAALTKGAVYPIVKSIMKWFGVKLTKAVFAGFFKKAIPVAGGVIGGGITFLTFKPCCDRLKKVLQDTKLSNPEHESSKEENEFVAKISSGEIIDADYTDAVPESEPFTEDELES